MQIDTTEGLGRLRINVNDGAVYDGDPETDNRRRVLPPLTR